jgi:hypothetical protein
VQGGTPRASAWWGRAPLTALRAHVRSEVYKATRAAPTAVKATLEARRPIT